MAFIPAVLSTTQRLVGSKGAGAIVLILAVKLSFFRHRYALIIVLFLRIYDHFYTTPRKPPNFRGCSRHRSIVLELVAAIISLLALGASHSCSCASRTLVDCRLTAQCTFFVKAEGIRGEVLRIGLGPSNLYRVFREGAAQVRSGRMR